MAYLKRITKKYKSGTKFNYYSVIKSSNWSKVKNISLKTNDEDTALERHEEVEDFENQIKRGKQGNWTWEDDNHSGRTRIVKFTLNKLIDKFVSIHKTNVRASTLQRYRCSYNCLTNVLGKSYPLTALNNQSIETFKKFYKGVHTNNGININLRAIKTLLLWATDEGYIKKMPKIKMMPTEEQIKYINDNDWNKIMELDIDEFYKDSFKLLRGIGVRRSDLVKGRLDGSFLVVDAVNEKTNTNKEILLTDEQIELVIKVHNKRDESVARGTSIDTFLSSLTRAFQKACMDIGIYQRGKTNLHCLRHTFAVREWIKSRDIFKVCLLLHHTSVTTTEKYARLNIHRLEQDFPSLIEVSKVSKIRRLETKKGTTNLYNNTSSPLYN